MWSYLYINHQFILKLFEIFVIWLRMFLAEWIALKKGFKVKVKNKTEITKINYVELQT